jgi:hypothetical protein
MAAMREIRLRKRYGGGGSRVSAQSQAVGDLEKRVAREGRPGLSWQGCAAPNQTNAERISELKRKIGQQTMEIDFLKKVLRRFREHPLPVAVNGGTDSMSKSKRRPKRGQS